METKVGQSRAALIALGISCIALLALAPSATAACPNEAIRSEQGAASLALPDCRAYELASPGSIPSLTNVSLFTSGGKASPEGNAVSYFSRYPAAGSQTSSEAWLSRRTGAGWTAGGLDPQMTPKSNAQGGGICAPGVALSEDLDNYVLSAGGEIYSSNIFDPEGDCELPEEEVVPGEPRGYSNLYSRHLAEPYDLINPLPSGKAPANATYQAASDDLSHVVFSEDAQLTPDSAPGSNLFQWSGGVVRAIGVLPNGDQVPARLAAGTLDWGTLEPQNVANGWQLGLAPISHAVSADGERVFFQANGNLYLRENAAQAPAATADCRTTSEPDLACTLQIDRSFGADASGGGVFQFASRNGNRVFFTSDHKLASPAGAQPGKPDLYEVQVSTRKITNLTAGSGEAANVRGFSGGSDDGSHIYFVARGVLTGTEQNAQNEVALAGEPNLYVSQNGALTYVATLSPWESSGAAGGRDHRNWWEAVGPPPNTELARLETMWSPSGRYLLFSAYKALTGFDNAPAAPGLCEGEPTCKEMFLYDAEEEGLSCVSCAPSGARPVANSDVGERVEILRFSSGPRYMPRVVSDGGQVFFDTENSLSSADVNGFRDVYEYRSGNLRLISSGTAVGGSAFIDASANGRDVFFATPESLVRSDTDGGLPSVYDARIDGGFTEPSPPPAPCTSGETCRTAAPPPAMAPPPTAGFVGKGNVRPPRCKAGKVRRGDRCVKKAKKKKGHAHGGKSQRSGRKSR